MRTEPGSTPRHSPGPSQDFSGLSASPRCGWDPSKRPGTLQGCHRPSPDEDSALICSPVLSRAVTEFCGVRI